MTPERVQCGPTTETPRLRAWSFCRPSKPQHREFGHEKELRWTAYAFVLTAGTGADTQSHADDHVDQQQHHPSTPRERKADRNGGASGGDSRYAHRQRHFSE